MLEIDELDKSVSAEQRTQARLLMSHRGVELTQLANEVFLEMICD